MFLIISIRIRMIITPRLHLIIINMLII